MSALPAHSCRSARTRYIYNPDLHIDAVKVKTRDFK